MKTWRVRVASSRSQSSHQRNRDNSRGLGPNFADPRQRGEPHTRQLHAFTTRSKSRGGQHTLQDGGCTHRTTQSHQTGAKDDISRYIGKNVRANTIVDVAVQPTSDTILSARSGRFTRLGHTTGVTKRNSEWPGNTVKQPNNEPVELGCAKCGHCTHHWRRRVQCHRRNGPDGHLRHRPTCTALHHLQEGK